MDDPGNNGFFTATVFGAGTFTVANASGVTKSSQIGIGVCESDCNCGIVVRGNAAGTHCYYVIAGTNSYSGDRVYCVELWRIYNGIETAISLFGQPYADIPDKAGDTYKLRAIGSNLSVSKNGEILGQVTDNSVVSGTPGIFSWCLSGKNQYKWSNWGDSGVMTADPPGNSGTVWTNWVAGDIQSVGTFTFVQAKVGGAVSPSLSQAASYDSNNTAGNLLVCQIGFGSSGTFSSLIDSAGNTWVRIGGIHSLPDGNSTGLFYVASCKAGPNTVAVTLTGSVAINFLGISEYSPGTGFVSSLDSAFFSTDNSPTTPSIGPLSVMGSGELILGCVYVDNLSNTAVAGTGYTLRYGATTTNTVILEDILNGTSSNQTAGIMGTTNNWQGWVAAFISSLVPIPPPPVTTVYSIPDCRITKPNSATSRTVNGTLIDDVQISSNHVIPPVDSRTAGAPKASGTYPQNSRTPGTFGPGV
jgi:hypothetical protein